MLSHHSHHLNHGADFKAFPIGIFTPILPPKTYLLHFQLTFFYTCFFTLHGKTNLVQFSSHISISNLPDYYIQNLPGSFQSHTALPNYSPPQLLHGELLNHGSLVPSIDYRRSSGCGKRCEDGTPKTIKRLLSCYTHHVYFSLYIPQLSCPYL